MCKFSPWLPEQVGLPEYLPIGLPKLPTAEDGPRASLINAWAKDCDQHGCREGKTSILPKRVIEIRGNIQDPKLRLFCPEADTVGSYVALSYKWGDKEIRQRWEEMDIDDPNRKFFQTLESDFQNYVKDIPFSRLPTTFQNAARVVLSVGIPYLWVDSFCILQDSDEDKREQFRAMEDVFSNAYFTIAACAAEHMDHGFLRRHPHARTVVPMKSGGGLSYFVCECIDNFHIDAEESGMSKRGWVFQERALSARSLFFTDSQMYWECGQGVRCETLIRMKK